MPREVGRAVAAVEAGDVGVGLLEAGVLGAGQRQVAHDVQASGRRPRPSRAPRDDDLGHEPDQPLHLEDVQPAERAGSTAPARSPPRVLVAVLAADALVAARAERPAAVLGRRAVAGEQHAPDVAGLRAWSSAVYSSSTVLRAERVAHLGAVERDAHRALTVGAVVGDVGEREAGDGGPASRIEDGARHAVPYHGPREAPARRPVVRQWR
jgi:hypothetical protein